MVGRFLITCSDERTWKFDRPVLFLGDWCCRYDRKHIWKQMNAIVASPYGLSNSVKAADKLEARLYEEKLFNVIINKLNKIHNKQYSGRFWRILIGHWLRYFTEVMINRINTFELCLKNYEIEGMAAFSNENFSLASQNTYQAILAFDNDRWNNELYYQIYQKLNANKIYIETIKFDEQKKSNTIINESKISRDKLKKRISRIKKLFDFLIKENDIFIKSSYLSKKEEVFLFFMLKQWPQFWLESSTEIIFKHDKELRKKLSNDFNGLTSDNRFDLICALAFENMPLCYIEGFTEMIDCAKKLPWPKKPKLILTANSFITDEPFKYWTALKTELGTKYLVVQHGANYGTHLYIENNTIEQITADKFLSWGWSDPFSNTIPCVIIKKRIHKSYNIKPKYGLLLVEPEIRHRINTWDNYAEHGLHFNNQLTFISNLEERVKKHLTVRLHPLYKEYNWFEDKRYHEYDPCINIEYSENIEKLFRKNRLIVFSYDSTGLLQTLSGNIPTIAFWDNKLDHLVKSAQPYYQMLVNVGILHFSSESAAEIINNKWDNISEWWRCDKVQEARLSFCNQYARSSNYRVRKLKNILNCYSDNE
jgi:putative transferase (TIGR04331 family)